MRTYFKYLLLFGLLGLFVSCQDDQITFEDPDVIQLESRSCSTTEDYFSQNILATVAQCSACHFDHDGSAELKIVNGEQYNNYLNMRQYLPF